MQANLRATVRDGYVSNGDVRLHYIVHEPSAHSGADASAVPLVILPGITSPAATWNFVAAPLAASIPTYVLDQRGRGFSDSPETGYTLPLYSTDAAALIRELGLERPVVLGHSMGGRIAIDFAARFPELLKAVSVVDAPISGPTTHEFEGKLSYYLDSLRDAKAGVTPEEFRRYHPTWTTEQLEDRLQWLPTCSAAAITESFELLNVEDVTAPWRDIRCPIQLVVGADSPIISVTEGKWLADQHDHCELVVVPAAAHMIPWDNLDEFLAVVRRFYSSVTTASA